MAATDTLGVTCQELFSPYAAVFAGLLLLYFHLSTRNSLPLPPGPRGLPIIGNLLQSPKSKAWTVFYKWSQQYGPIVSVKYGQKTTIILSSHEIVRDLFAKRNLKYSSRPELVGLTRVTKSLHSGLMPYGPRWRTTRTIQGTFLRPSMARKYRPLQEIQSLRVLHELLTTNDFASCFRRLISGMFLTLAYGLPEWPDNAMLDEWEKLTKDKTKYLEPAFLVSGPMAEFFPFLKHLPVKWKRDGDDMYHRRDEIFRRYLSAAHTRAQSPDSPWSWTKSQFAHKSAQDLTFTEHVHIMGSLGEAAQTPFHALCAVLSSIHLHPEAVTKAQSEIDRVVGTGTSTRLPVFSDLPNLPYVDAFIKESLRWRSVMPILTPRIARTEDTYNGYRIPSQATILVNLWALDHDPAVFADPSSFLPDRWIEDPNLPSFLFGMGHRSCPGEQMGLDSLAIMAARILWAYRVEGPRNGWTPVYKSVGSTFINPIPSFEAHFFVRGEERKALIEREWAGAEKETGVLLAGIVQD